MDIANVLSEIRRMIYHLPGTENLKINSEVVGLVDGIEQARREWHSAQAYYDAVSDTDLVDYAVYLMQAAEKKYTYLLKQARREGIISSDYFLDEEKMQNKFSP
jgi:hypothetical protein